MIKFEGFTKYEVVAALVNEGRPIGMGILHYRKVTPLDVEREWRGDHIDYFMGVPIKADFSGDSFDPWGYNRDQGENSAERAMLRLRQSKA